MTRQLARSKRDATVWTSHLQNPEHKTIFLEGLSHQFNSPQWQRLREIIDQKIETIEKERLTGYDSPSWAYHQAHVNGYRQALNELVQLLPLDQKEKHK